MGLALNIVKLGLTTNTNGIGFTPMNTNRLKVGLLIDWW